MHGVVMNKQVVEKFSDIVQQLTREIETTKATFIDLESTPPLSRNQPPVAGSIAWSRGLFLRTRNTMKHFQKMRISLQLEGEGQEVEELFKEPLAEGDAL